MKQTIEQTANGSAIISFRPEPAEMTAFLDAVKNLGASKTELALLAWRRGYRIAVAELAKERKERIKMFEAAAAEARISDADYKNKVGQELREGVKNLLCK
jgi:hypothetical protein